MDLSDLTKIASDEQRSIEYVEAMRWPNGAVCPHCGCLGRAYRLQVKDRKGNARLGVWKCGDCRKQFTVRIGTIFEESHIPLSKWLLALHLMCSSKKGVSAKQIEREIGVTYKSAWFLCHRIRHAMTRESPDKLGGGGEIVEIDETFVGGKAKNNKHFGYVAKPKPVVLTLVERGGDARAIAVKNAKARTLLAQIAGNVSIEAHAMTDGWAGYDSLGRIVSKHEVVDHKYTYVRGIVHTNFAESFHSLLKRAIMGAFHHISAQHVQRYVDEATFKWNTRKATDGARMTEALRGVEGKRLTYRPTARA